MYAVSSQRRYWTFGSEKEIDELRQQQNRNFILKATRGHDVDVNEIDWSIHMELIIFYLIFPGEQFVAILSNSQRGENSIEKL